MTDEEYEAKLSEFETLARQVKMPTLPRLYIAAAKWKPQRMPDPANGLADILAIEQAYRAKLVRPDIDYEKRASSILRNLYNGCAKCYLSVADTDASTWGDGHINCKEVITGTLRSGNITAYPVGIYEQTTYGDATQEGIHVGTDNTGVSIDDYGCIAKISHGDGAGQLRYWNMFSMAKSYNAGTRVWTQEFVRYFTNHSGGSITVREMALVGRWYYYMAANSYIAICRDLLSPAIDVGNLELIRCKYTFTFGAFPA